MHLWTLEPRTVQGCGDRTAAVDVSVAGGDYSIDDGNAQNHVCHTNRGLASAIGLGTCLWP